MSASGWTPHWAVNTPEHLNAAQLRRHTGEKRQVYLCVSFYLCVYLPEVCFSVCVCLPVCAALCGGEAHGIHLVHFQVAVEDLEDLLDVWDVTRLKL